MRIFYIDKAKLKSFGSIVFIMLLCIGALAVEAQEPAVTTAGVQDEELLSHVVSAGDPAKSAVSMMFMADENTDVNLLAETMQILADNKIKATFFLSGKFAESHGDMVQSMAESGHEIGVSGYEAVSPANLDYGENLAALEKADTAIRSITGQAVQLYSPPYGVLETDIYKAVNEMGMTFILAGVDSQDWDDVSTEAIISAVLTKAEKGSLICFHPTQMTNLGMQTIINELKGLKLKVLPVGENISK